MERKITVPVLFLIFNQPAITARTFEEIRRAKPKRLFISADGPRLHKLGEAEECQETRDLVLKNIDWECEVTTRFLETNQGCKRAVSSAITWFLEQAGEGIILEFDCVPSQSFFWFCQALLEKYRNDTRIMAIGGSNGQLGIQRGDASYYFSRVTAIWGWATWKRAWQFWDADVSSFPSFKKHNEIKAIFHNKEVQKFYLQKIEGVYTGVNRTTWGFCWLYAVFVQNGLVVIPNVNLISNIGFSVHATHATGVNYIFENLPKGEMDVDRILHPQHFIPNIEADQYSTKLVIEMERPGLLQNLKNISKLIIPKKYHQDVKRLLGL